MFEPDKSPGLAPEREAAPAWNRRENVYSAVNTLVVLVYGSYIQWTHGEPAQAS